MEAALNLVWLFIAATSFALAAYRISRTAGLRRLCASEWRLLIALSCSLVILFFVISMTDDIHELQVASEESQSRRLIPKDGSQASNGKHSHPVDFHRGFWLTSEPHPVVWICVGHVEPLCSTESGIAGTRPPSGRDPPLFSA
jgi:hypothetical protein